jgi:PAS domain S-box-containing protein
MVLAAAGFAMAIAVANLVGWAFHLERLLSVYPGMPRMVPNTAVGVLGIGLALVLVQSERSAVRRIGQAVAALVLGLGAATLFEFVSGWSLGFDTWLFGDARLIPSAPAGRPGLYTAVDLTVLSTAILLLDVGGGRRVRPTEVLALVAILIALQVVAGYVYGAESLYVKPGPAAMSLLASLCYLALGLGVLWSRPHAGVMSVVTSELLGGRVARRFLLAVGGLLVLGLVVMLGQRAGLYDKPVAGVLLAMGSLLLWLPVLLATSGALNRVDAQRRRYELELERWRLYFAQAAWGALVANAAGKLVLINRAFAEMQGASLDELAGKSLFSVLAPTRAEELQALLTTASESGRHRFEWREQPHEGRAGRVLLVDVTVIDSRDRLLHYGLYVEDITAQKEAEVERERLLVRERQANARVGLLAETSSALARSLDHETTLKALAHLLVPRLADYCAIYLLDEPRGRRLVAFAHVDPGKERLLEKAEPTPPEVEKAVLAPRSMISVPFVAHARPLGEMAMAYSESDRRYQPGDRELMEQIAGGAAIAVENARLYHEAVAAARARDDVIAIVSHDLRNPLTVVDLNAHVLELANACTAPRSRRALDTIRKAVKRMASLIDDLLTASATESGTLLVERRPCRLADLVEEIFELVEPLATAKSVKLESAIAPSLLVQCDPQRTLQVLTNLIGNSIKFTPDGGVVHLAGHVLDGEVCVGVSDTGEGIAEQDLPHIFDRFWKGHVSGTGLGLFIAKCLVEAQGGNIWVESKLGRGSTFFFTLPLAAVETRAGAHS